MSVVCAPMARLYAAFVVCSSNFGTASLSERQMCRDKVLDLFVGNKG